MSGQWEVVIKSKGKSNSQNSKKLTKTEKKKFAENAPKIEDLLPLSQVKSLYNSLDNNNEDSEQTNKNKANKENAPKQQPQQQKKKNNNNNNNNDKKKEVKEKPVLPKNLEQALKKFNVKEFSEHLSMNQSLYQDTPLIWFKNLAEYMNLNLNHSNPSTSFKVNEYPLSVVQTEIKDVLKRAFVSAGDAATQHFFEFCLTLLANDMNKGVTSIIGYKIILQMIAFQKPSITTSNTEKYNNLLKSYQSRPPIAKTILWCLGQGGVKDISKGIEIWWKYVTPLISMKNYSSFAIEYLKDILSLKGNSKAISPEELNKLFNYLYTRQAQIISKTDLKELATSLKNKSIDLENDNKLSPYFQNLLPALNSLISKEYKLELENCLITCLLRDKQSYSTWTQIYTKNIKQSSILLSAIDAEYKKYSNQLQMKLLRKTISTFQVTNQDLLKTKKEDQLLDCQKVCQELNKKMTLSGKSSFPWKFGSFLLIVGIASVLTYDIRIHGSFKSSSTALFLKDIGALKHGEQAWTKVSKFSDDSYVWAQANLPYYTTIAADYLGPVLKEIFNFVIFAGQMLIDNFILIRNYIQEKIPVVHAWIEQYAPGLLDSIREYSLTLWSSAKHYSAVIWAWILDFSAPYLQWAKNNMVSTENLQEYSLNALNTTQFYAVWTYDWISQKVQSFTKVKNM